MASFLSQTLSFSNQYQIERNIIEVQRWLFAGLDGMNTARSTGGCGRLSFIGLGGRALGNLEKQPV